MQLPVPALLAVGILTVAGLYCGYAARRVRLPSIIGFMLLGVILGPSGFNIITKHMEEQLSFLPMIVLGFVALTIGLELKVSWLRTRGWGLIATIFAEAGGAFAAVAGLVYIVCRYMAVPAFLADGGQQCVVLAILLGSMAAATAPAGTIAVIQETRAKGSFTQTLYAVVGFDDALAVIIYAFALAAASSFLMAETGTVSGNMLYGLIGPAGELLLSVSVGAAIGVVFCILARRKTRMSDNLILIVGCVLLANGLSTVLHLSFILTNLAFGFVVGNTQPYSLLQKIRDDMHVIMPLLFIFMFGLAGANLDVRLIPRLGFIGLAYILARSFGKIVGAKVGATVGGMEPNVSKYLGIGLLSQAGVAIGLALITLQHLRTLGAPVALPDGGTVPSGQLLGTWIVTIVAASCVFFEIIGPVLVRYALTKSGEVPGDSDPPDDQ